MEIPETQAENQPNKAPGVLLTEARLKLGLEPQNVAEMLHLRVHQIHALEADDFDNLPEPTYVKGYLRAYCQLLSLDPDAIVKMYSDLIKPAEPESFEGIAPEKQTASNDNLVKMFSAGLVALVAALTITFWYSNKNDQTVDSVSVTTSSAPPVVEPESPVDVSEMQREGQAEKFPAQINVEGASDTDNNVPSGSSGSIATTAAPVVEQTTPITVSPVPVQSPEPVAGVNNQTSLLPESDNLARTRLLIKVNEGSWIDLRDARDNKLIYETVPSGREIPLEGLAPFKVFLGNASGVQVFLEGKPFDFSSHQRGLTARFTLDKAPGAR